MMEDSQCFPVFFLRESGGESGKFTECCKMVIGYGDWNGFIAPLFEKTTKEILQGGQKKRYCLIHLDRHGCSGNNEDHFFHLFRQVLFGDYINNVQDVILCHIDGFAGIDFFATAIKNQVNDRFHG